MGMGQMGMGINQQQQMFNPYLMHQQMSQQHQPMNYYNQEYSQSQSQNFGQDQDQGDQGQEQVEK